MQSIAAALTIGAETLPAKTSALLGTSINSVTVRVGGSFGSKPEQQLAAAARGRKATTGTMRLRVAICACAVFEPHRRQLRNRWTLRIEQRFAHSRAR